MVSKKASRKFISRIIVKGIAPTRERMIQDIVHIDIESLRESGYVVVTFFSMRSSRIVAKAGIRKAIRRGEVEKFSPQNIPAPMGRSKRAPPILKIVAR